MLVPAGETSVDRIGHLETVDDEEIARMLLRAAGRAGGASGRRDSLTSLPGMEPKIALALDPQGRWNRCVDGAPSTHILKLSREAGSATADTIDTEAAALDLARRIGLTTVDAHVATFGGVRAIVVSRYDRIASSDGVTARLHQEDCAQAMGLDTRNPDRKFQFGRSLPSLLRIAQLLREGASEPDELLRLTTFNLAIGNTDAHAKNISLLHPDDGTVSLAPAYDVAMHLHADVPGESAMDIAGRRAMRDVTGPDLLQEAMSWGMPARRAERVVAATLDELRTALEEIDRDRHPGVRDLAWRTVEKRTQQLADQLAPVQRAARPQGRAHATQPRRPKGSPRGGQFGTMHRSEPDPEP
ncbi:HipA domain-containing protein [Cellulomonas marina]|uniref:Serine/threonine-protein kinase HipA n=1 Tax=Cellulomonas marina TaxID=988821 RepID=A0A1I0XX19_9CELL|nr:HipA domain-containing protein [Cellulomonas marina]SFB04986.1 serine/threonine-protein kinase HipA [Cellulomonas marina]